MILNALIDIAVGLVSFLIGLLPSIKFAIPVQVFETISDMVTGLSYVVPVVGLLPIIAIGFSIKTAQITWALLSKLRSLSRF